MLYVWYVWPHICSTHAPTILTQLKYLNATASSFLLPFVISEPVHHHQKATTTAQLIINLSGMRVSTILCLAGGLIVGGVAAPTMPLVQEGPGTAVILPRAAVSENQYAGRYGGMRPATKAGMAQHHRRPAANTPAQANPVNTWNNPAEHGHGPVVLYPDGLDSFDNRTAHVLGEGRGPAYPVPKSQFGKFFKAAGSELVAGRLPKLKLREKRCRDSILELGKNCNGKPGIGGSCISIFSVCLDTFDACSC